MRRHVSSVHSACSALYEYSNIASAAAHFFQRRIYFLITRVDVKNTRHRSSACPLFVVRSQSSFLLVSLHSFLAKYMHTYVRIYIYIYDVPPRARVVQRGCITVSRLFDVKLYFQLSLEPSRTKGTSGIFLMGKVLAGGNEWNPFLVSVTVIDCT